MRSELKLPPPRRLQKWLLLLLLPLFTLFAAPVTSAQQQSSADDALQVMEAFNEEAKAKQDAYALADEKKHQILFYMGAGLLILLCATAYLGVSMVVFNKQVFVPHMICAGLTVTLGIAHAVAAAVWFFPF